MTKRKVLIWGGVGVFLFFLLGREIPLLCGLYNYICQDKFESLFSIFFVFFPLLLLSLLTYKMKEEVFQAWWGFTRWFLPLSIFLILIMPGGQGGGFGVPSVFDREFLAFILAALFFLVSLGIIAVKWRKMRKG